MLNEREIIKAVLSQYKLNPLGAHGIGHWARVYENGMALADRYEWGEQQRDVLRLFAILHDACRLNENSDREHGRRVNPFMQHLEETTDLFADYRVPQLAACLFAIEFHADGKTAKDFPPGKIDLHPEVQACWDADRLDLDRVGIKPDKRLLGIQDDWLINNRRKRGLARAIPKLVFEQWGVEIKLP